MPSNDFRTVHLPYCIKKLPNGNHVVLNRDYKPIGFRTTAHLDYEAYPIGVKFKRLTAKTVEKLSFKGSADADVIYLYNDGSIPTASENNMREYLDRLAILAKLQFTEQKIGLDECALLRPNGLRPKPNLRCSWIEAGLPGRFD